MAAPSVSYSFTNGTTADGTQVSQNFTDIINGITDGTKDLSISALTCAGNVSITGSSTLTIASGKVNKVTITAPASSAVLTISDGKTLTCSNTITFTATDSSTVAFSGGGTVAYVPTSQIRSNVGNGFGSTNTMIRRLTNHVTIGSGITATDSSTLGTYYTINEAGVYSISYSDRKVSGAAVHGISLNSANLTTAVYSLSAAERLMDIETTSQHACVAVTVRLAVNDVIRPHTNALQDATATEVQFIITQVAKL